MARGISGERAMALLLASAGIAHEREYRFNPLRRWRFDFAIPMHAIAIEVEGGVWTQGRHTRGSGYIKDCEKYNSAVMLGWRVLRYPATEITAYCLDDIKQLMGK